MKVAHILSSREGRRGKGDSQGSAEENKKRKDAEEDEGGEPVEEVEEEVGLLSASLEIATRKLLENNWQQVLDYSISFCFGTGGLETSKTKSTRCLKEGSGRHK